MNYVQTVNGLIAENELGITLAHEHVFIDSLVWFVEPKDDFFKEIRDAPITLGNIDRLRRGTNFSRNNLIVDEVDVAIEEVAHFKLYGGKTIVDLSVDGIGRDIKKLKEVSDKSGLNIIAPTGYYVENSHPKEIKNMSIDEIANRFINDIKIGIQGTDIKAGIIGEIGISPNGNRSEEEKVVKAAARAQLETGAPLTVHTWGDNASHRQPLHIIDILENEGVDLTRVYMSHMDSVDDYEYLKQIAQRKVLLSFDTFGQEFPALFYHFRSITPVDLDRARIIKKLVDDGFLSQILLSHDVCKKSNLKKYGGWGFSHLLTSVKEVFDYVGITKQHLDYMFVKNPMQVLPIKKS